MEKLDQDVFDMVVVTPGLLNKMNLQIVIYDLESFEILCIIEENAKCDNLKYDITSYYTTEVT